MRRLVALLCLVLPAAALVAPTSPAAADEVISDLGGFSPHTLVALPEVDRLVMSGMGPDAGSIKVFTLAGEDVGVVEGFLYPQALRQSADGRIVVTQVDDDRMTGRVAVLDPVTATVEPVDLGPACPRDAVLAGGRIWYADECYDTVRSYDPSSGEIVDVLPAGSGAGLVASGSDPDRVYALTDHDGTVKVHALSAADGGVVQESVLPHDLYSAAGSLHLSEDDAELLVRTDDDGTVAYDAALLTKLRRYRTFGNMAMSAEGVLASADYDISVFAARDNERMNTYASNDTYAIDFVGEKLYYVRATRTGPSLRALVPQWDSEVVVRLMEQHVDYKQAAVSVRLRSRSSDRTVSIWFDPKGSLPERRVRTVEVPEDAEVEARVPADRHGRIIARYDGDDEVEGSTAATVVYVYGKIVNRSIDHIRREGSVHLVPTSGYATIVGRVLPPKPGAEVFVQWQFRVNGRWLRHNDTVVRQDEYGRAGLRLRGHPDIAGRLMRVRLVSPGNRQTYGGGGEWVLYRWIR